MACDPAAIIRYIRADERLIGANHPEALEDTLNRPIRDLLTALGLDPDAPLDGCSLIGGGVTTRKVEWVAEPAYGQGSIDTVWDGDAYNLNGLPFSPSATPLGRAWVNFGTATFFRVVNGVKVIDLTPAAASVSMYLFRPTSGGATPPTCLDFSDQFTNLLDTGASGFPIPLAYTIEAWIRKKVSGDGTKARQFFGFANVTDTTKQKRTAMVGLLGDGTTGFHFGSLNCPDCPGGGFQNGAADIDAGSIQPASLIDPQDKWMHVRVKMVPPIPNVQGGMIGTYLNKVLIKTFDTTTNFPRVSNSPIDVPNALYFGIQPCLAIWNNPDTVTIDKGLYLRDLRFSYDEDITL